MTGVKTHDFCQVLFVMCDVYHLSAIQIIQTLPTLGGVEGIVPVKNLKVEKQNKTN